MEKKLMNPEIKAKWLAALRSGDYKQGSGALCQDNYHGQLTYCCLGVLCDIFSKEKDIHWSRSFNDISSFQGATGTLPFEVCAWAGMSSNTGEYLDESGKWINLAILNDGIFGMIKPLSFDEIADVIEKEL